MTMQFNLTICTKGLESQLETALRLNHLAVTDSTSGSYNHGRPGRTWSNFSL